MNSGNPIEDWAQKCADDALVEKIEGNRISVAFNCDLCKRNFREGGLEFEFETACDDCINDGTVKADFREKGMGDGLIERLFIHATKIEH